MNFLLLFKLLSRIVFLIAAAMVFSLPWAFPAIGGSAEFEFDGFFGLVGSIAIALIAGSLLFYLLAIRWLRTTQLYGTANGFS